MPLMGLALFICYVWGRYYAAKLDYARTVRNFLSDTDTLRSEESESEDFFRNNRQSVNTPQDGTDTRSLPNLTETKTDS